MSYFLRYGKFSAFFLGILCFFIFSALIGSRNLKKYEILAENGKKAEMATVLLKEPTNHQFVNYTYQVHGIRYEGSGRAGNGNPEFEQLNSGDIVTVFYDPNSPEISILGNPQIWFEQEQNSVYYGSLIMATFVSLILFAGLHFLINFLKKI